jgi:hypothetical protein
VAENAQFTCFVVPLRFSFATMRQSFPYATTYSVATLQDPASKKIFALASWTIEGDLGDV